MAETMLSLIPSNLSPAEIVHKAAQYSMELRGKHLVLPISYLLAYRSVFYVEGGITHHIRYSGQKEWRELSFARQKSRLIRATRQDDGAHLSVVYFDNNLGTLDLEKAAAECIAHAALHMKDLPPDALVDASRGQGGIFGEEAALFSRHLRLPRPVLQTYLVDYGLSIEDTAQQLCAAPEEIESQITCFKLGAHVARAAAQRRYLHHTAG